MLLVSTNWSPWVQHEYRLGKNKDNGSHAGIILLWFWLLYTRRYNPLGAFFLLLLRALALGTVNLICFLLKSIPDNWFLFCFVFCLIIIKQFYWTKVFIQIDFRIKEGGLSVTKSKTKKKKKYICLFKVFNVNK